MVSAVVKVFETTTTAIIKNNNIKTCKLILHIYLSTQTHTHTHTHIYLYIYIERERERCTHLPRVVSGFNPVILLATSIGSTFARLQVDSN